MHTWENLLAGLVHRWGWVRGGLTGILGGGAGRVERWGVGMAIITWSVMGKQGLGTFFPLVPGSVQRCEVWGWQGSAEGKALPPMPGSEASAAHSVLVPQAAV